MSIALDQCRYFYVLLLVVILTFFLFWVFRWQPVDDAYTTFRYAWNISRGNGFVYNPGESVLGTTTPLWTLILALWTWLGFPVEVVSVLLSFFFSAVCAIGLAYILRERVSAAVSLCLVCCLILYFPLNAAISSGMETSFYIFLVAGSLVAIKLGHYSLAALFGALAFLTRPDGVLTFFVLAAAAARTPAKLLRALILFAGVVLPWLIFAHSKFGSLVPQSVIAKQVIHPATVWGNILIISQAFCLNPVDFLIAVFGAAGVLYRAIIRKEWIFVLWCVLYVSGLAASGVKPIFYWYFTPIWLFLIGYGVLGVVDWRDVNRHKFRPRVLTLCGVLLPLIGFLLIGYSILRLSQADPEISRQRIYRQIAESFSAEIKPDQTVYLCETGILGYALLRNKIIDSSGINSLEAFSYRRRAREALIAQGKPYANAGRHIPWSVDLVQDLKPDWIISPRHWCQLFILEDLPWFSENYQRLTLYDYPDLGGIGVYEKKIHEKAH